MSLFEPITIAAFCLFVTLMLPRLKTTIGLVLTLVILAGYGLASTIVYSTPEIWIKIPVPMTILILGYATVGCKRILNFKRKEKKALTDSAETDKTLGLFYQQQGMLDLAFEKFRSLPQADDIKDLLYNLGLDYEEKDQLKKALIVFKTIIREGENSEDRDDHIFKLREAISDSLLTDQSDSHLSTSINVDIETFIGDYKVSGEIRRDAIGVVCRGEELGTGNTVAIRTVNLSYFDKGPREEVRDRFFSETEPFHRLAHPNIVKIKEVKEHKGLFYIVMDYLEGESLANYTKKDHLLPTRETLRVIGCVADGLDYAHRNKLVHHHITPTNIIRVKDTREIKITDFGTAWLLSFIKNKPDLLLENACYMSPEQISGKKANGRSDIFSLGVVLFEMLTGEKPFEGEDVTSVVLKISKETHPSPRFYNPKIPRVVEKIIDKALEKDLEKRYQTASQMADHLNKVVAKIDELLNQKKLRQT